MEYLGVLKVCFYFHSTAVYHQMCFNGFLRRAVLLTAVPLIQMNLHLTGQTDICTYELYYE